MIKIFEAVGRLTSGMALIICGIFILLATVTYLAAAEAIAIIAPILAWAVAGCGLVAVVLASAAFWLDRCQRIALGLVEFWRDFNIARNDTERDYNKLVFEGRVMDAVANQAEYGLIYPVSLSDGKFSSFPKATINQIENSGVPLLENPVMNFETIARKALSSRGAGRFIVYGAMDAGKTTLAKHTIAYAVDIISKRGGTVYVIDPHAPDVIWGDNIEVIGAGLDYTSIANFLDWVVTDVKARYEAGCGDDSQPLPEPYKPTFIICEEWAGVIAELQATKRWTNIHNRTFYQDARKAGIGFFLVAHEHTVTALGLQGMSNLLNGVEYFVTLDKDPIQDKFSATLGRSFKDKNAYELVTPGAYEGQLHYSKMQAAGERGKTDKYVVYDNPSPIQFVVAEPEPAPPRPSPEEMAIIEAVATVKMDNDGKIIWSRVTKELGWTATGPNNDRIKAVLDKWNISY